MGISNTQFSLLQSSLTLFPTIIPLLGGILVERYGTGPSSIVFTSIVILGQVIVILGCWTYSVKIMIVGYCLFGYVSLHTAANASGPKRQRFFKPWLIIGINTGELSGNSKRQPRCSAHRNYPGNDLGSIFQEERSCVGLGVGNDQRQTGMTVEIGRAHV